MTEQGITLDFTSGGTACVVSKLKQQCFGDFKCEFCEHEPEETFYIDGKILKMQRWFCKYGNQYVVTYDNCPAGFWVKMEYPPERKIIKLT